MLITYFLWQYPRQNYSQVHEEFHSCWMDIMHDHSLKCFPSWLKLLRWLSVQPSCSFIIHFQEVGMLAIKCWRTLAFQIIIITSKRGLCLHWKGAKYVFVYMNQAIILWIKEKVSCINWIFEFFYSIPMRSMHACSSFVAHQNINLCDLTELRTCKLPLCSI